MNTESFEKTVRTFGASPSRWETEQTDELAEWAQNDGKEIVYTAVETVVPNGYYSKAVDETGRTVITNSRVVDTGDRSDIMPWVMVLTVSMIAILTLSVSDKKRKRHS